MRRGSSSTSSRRSFPNRYRTMAPTSQVDETLFGNPKSKSEERETVQIITKDLIRNLRVPQTDPSDESIVISSAELKRIASKSKVLVKKEREALKEAYQRKKEEEINAAEERKHRIHEADLSRNENQAPSELQLEAQARAQRLVERASALKMEQEDEIKQLNQLILGAQCQATRDAQIQERNAIQEVLAEEEKRLDAMMEAERRRALETVEKIDEERKQQRIRGMQQIYNQIQQRQEEMEMQEEMKDRERQQIRENQEKMNLEDLKALEKKWEEQQLLQEEIKRINAETVRAKQQRMEEERLADMRDMEYIKNKLEREAEYEAEQKQIKKEKELEIARLRAQQEKAKDYKAEQDELRAKRNQESMQREWRRKEKELAVKKAQEEGTLRAARLEQVLSKEQCLSIEAGREKAEFERLLKVQQEAILKQKEQEQRQREKAHHHAEAIRQQIKEHELSAIAKRREIFKEADRLEEQARQRRMRLDVVKEKKLKELKDTGLSEKYCSEVERKTRTYTT